MNNKSDNKVPNHSHAWNGSWERPMKMDEDTLHPFTVARMTDHNVRGVDEEPMLQPLPISLDRWENEGGPTLQQ
ncbi:MAG: hypothetical protein AABZ31_14545 [Bdellovibrionota bacterium]